MHEFHGKVLFISTGWRSGGVGSKLRYGIARPEFQTELILTTFELPLPQLSSRRLVSVTTKEFLKVRTTTQGPPVSRKSYSERSER